MTLAEWVPWLRPKCHVSLVKICVNDAADVPRVWEIEQLPAIIGRAEESDIRLTDHWVSKIHCCLTEVNGNLVVHDLESRNGTSVHGAIVDEQPLQVGDTISIGMSEIRVLYIADENRLLSSRGSHPS